MLEEDGLAYEYEEETIEYIQPEVVRKYKPDFKIKGKDFYIEVKGKFDVEDRKKHLLLKAQGKAEVRFVFYNAYAKLRKGSKTTYADWCDKNGFQWAHRTIPEEWIKEN